MADLYPREPVVVNGKRLLLSNHADRMPVNIELCKAPVLVHNQGMTAPRKPTLFGWHQVPEMKRPQKFIDADLAEFQTKKGGHGQNYQSQLVKKMEEAAARRSKKPDSSATKE
ncbi:hypothetical protein [Curtobacterium sp. MCSS17_007]|uniref:hypothetical protein n=1 Tax=Curtobacterium sp. MCSS17_007 TaxID=2175646 RepID=UPI0011B7F066|nr:hypothetical protein [Curtobacterium sp. MCSS17_007]WIE74506.1 hypothetical protein DEJ22_009445 [Curtobacterium sp. MCSS17_007]